MTKPATHQGAQAAGSVAHGGGRGRTDSNFPAMVFFPWAHDGTQGHHVVAGICRAMVGLAQARALYACTSGESRHLITATGSALLPVDRGGKLAGAFGRPLFQFRFPATNPDGSRRHVGNSGGRRLLTFPGWVGGRHYEYQNPAQAGSASERQQTFRSVRVARVTVGVLGRLCGCRGKAFSPTYNAASGSGHTLAANPIHGEGLRLTADGPRARRQSHSRDNVAKAFPSPNWPRPSWRRNVVGSGDPSKDP